MSHKEWGESLLKFLSHNHQRVYGHHKTKINMLETVQYLCVSMFSPRIDIASKNINKYGLF